MAKHAAPPNRAQSQWSDEDILKAMPDNRNGIAAKLVMSSPTATKRVGLLHAAGRAHIEGWDKATAAGPWQARYAAGPGEDAPHPPPYVRRAAGAPEEAPAVVAAKGWAGSLSSALFGGAR